MIVEGHLKARWENLREPGDFMYTGRINVPIETVCGLMFICPCGCGSRGVLQIDSPFADHNRDKWTWDGNRERPTMSPSVRRTEGCGWHGYLQDGMWRPC